jgi:hypothetical protein
VHVQLGEPDHQMTVEHPTPGRSLEEVTGPGERPLGEAEFIVGRQPGASYMRDYNGFSGSQRQRAQKWLNREWGRGPPRAAFEMPQGEPAISQRHVEVHY